MDREKNKGERENKSGEVQMKWRDMLKIRREIEGKGR